MLRIDGGCLLRGTRTLMLGTAGIVRMIRWQLNFRVREFINSVEWVISQVPGNCMITDITASGVVYVHILRTESNIRDCLWDGILEIAQIAADRHYVVSHLAEPAAFFVYFQYFLQFAQPRDIDVLYCADEKRLLFRSESIKCNGTRLSRVRELVFPIGCKYPYLKPLNNHSSWPNPWMAT